jgi:hypothetical protein
MLGVFPIVVWTRESDDFSPYRAKTTWQGQSKSVEVLADGKGSILARVEARTVAGALVGAAEAECGYAEEKWRDSDAFAIRSMAQTRATAKALRLPLGFIMALAGYEATPSDEMNTDHVVAAKKVVFGLLGDDKEKAGEAWTGAKHELGLEAVDDGELTIAQTEEIITSVKTGGEDGTDVTS